MASRNLIEDGLWYASDGYLAFDNASADEALTVQRHVARAPSC